MRTVLSSTAVVMSAGQLVQSHTFLRITIQDIFLSYRSGVRSIMVSTLVLALWASAQNDSTVPQCLRKLLSRSCQDPDTIGVATSRLPSFGPDYQDPYNAFRRLGRLASLADGPEVLPETVDRWREVWAMDESSPLSQQFHQVWEPLGMEMETHFILIFILPKGYSVYSSPCNLISDALLSPQPSQHFSREEFLSRWRNWSGFDMSRYNQSSSDSDSPTPAHHETSWNGNSLQDVVANPPRSRDSSGLRPSCGLRIVFEAFGIDRDLQTAAKFARRVTLLEMVQNYNSMYSLLSDIGLPDRIGNMKVTYAGGRELQSSEVLVEFGWSVGSYKRKSAYSWAAEASKMLWKQDPPRECEPFQKLIEFEKLLFLEPHDTLHHAYYTWLGIRHFWGPKGPVATGRPLQRSSNVDEEAAYRLKQQDIYTHKTAIQRYLA
jgi:hypothetical protein